MNQDINVEQVLKMMCTIDGATEYLVTNAEGIPIKKSAGITPERALHISFLINDYWATTKKIVHNDLKMGDNPVEKIQIRTSKQQEIIIVQALRKCEGKVDGEATLYLVQNCFTKKQEPVEKKQSKPE